MSEADDQTYSILLPTARVMVFSRDPETLDASRGLDSDWRFARVDVEAQEGDVGTAIESFREVTSPDLVIIQTDDIDDGFTASLEALAEHCDEGTAAIVVGPVNDVYLYRRLIDMGVSDYLVKPLTADMLSDVIAKTLVERLGVRGSRLITFVGAKGGVGASALSQALAWGAADILQQKSLLLDVAGGWSSLSVGLGFEPVTTLSEAVRAASNDDEQGFKRMLFNAGPRLDVLAHGGDVMLDQPVSADQIERLLDLVMMRYPVVLCDLSESPALFKKVVLSRSNQIVVVSSALLPSLRLARSLIQEIKDLRGGSLQNIELLINMAGFGDGQEVPSKDIESVMEYKPSGIIPFDPKIFMQAETEAKKIIDLPQGRALVQDILIPIMQNVLSVEASSEASAPASSKEAGLFGSLMGKIVKK